MGSRNHDDKVHAEDVVDLQELVDLPFDKLHNPLAVRTWGATLICLVGIGCFMLWIDYALRGYLAWEAGTGTLPDTSIITAGIPIFLTAIAVELMLSLLSGREIYRLNDTVSSFSNGLLQQLFVITTTMLGDYFAVPLITAVPYAFIFNNYRIMDLSGWQGFLIMFFARDFCYYWFHRMGHRIAWMWAIHGVHHQPNEFNYAINLSQGMLQRVASAAFYAPLALFMNPQLYMVLFPMEKVFGALTHTKLVNQTKFIEYFFVTPSSHRVHHAGAPSKYIDKNYGEMLTIWDRMFGTFVSEDEPIVFGHVHPLDTWNPARSQTRLWLEIYEKSKSTPSLWRKFLCFWMPPGWNPVDGSEYPLVDSHPYQAVKYDSDLNAPMSAYVLVHFGGAIAAGIYLLRNFRLFDGLYELYMAIFYVVWILCSIGMMYDRSPYSLAVELPRLLVAPVVFATVMPDVFGAQSAPIALPFAPDLAFSAMHWLYALVATSALVLLANGNLFTITQSESRADYERRVWIYEAGRHYTDKVRAQQAMRKKTDASREEPTAKSPTTSSSVPAVNTSGASSASSGHSARSPRAVRRTAVEVQ